MKMRIVRLALLAGLLAGVGAQAAPAGTTGSASMQALCGLATPTFFDRVGAARAAGGVEPREPSMNDTTEEVPPGERGKGGPNFRAVVDVYFHVITNGELGDVSDNDVRTQIQVMNMEFGGFEGGVSTGFTFRLASIDRTDNAEWYNAGPTTSGEREMKKTFHRGDASDLNIYSTTAGPYLG